MSFIESFYLSRFGSLGFVSFYVLAIVVSMIPSYLEHRHSKDYLSLGASGVVSAVIFVAILFKPWQMLYLFAILPIPAIVFAIAYIAYGVYAHKKGSRRINHLAHLAGAAFGVIATILIEPKLIGDFLYELTHPRFF